MLFSHYVITITNNENRTLKLNDIFLKMDPNLTCIDPNLLQLSQLLEEDEEVPPPVRTPSAADDGGGGNKTAVEGKERIDVSETVASSSEAKKRLSEDDVLPSEQKKLRLDVKAEKVEDLRELAIN